MCYNLSSFSTSPSSFPDSCSNGDDQSFVYVLVKPPYRVSLCYRNKQMQVNGPVKQKVGGNKYQEKA